MPEEAVVAARVVDLGERFGCLPDAVLDADVSILRLVKIADLVKKAANGQ